MQSSILAVQKLFGLKGVSCWDNAKFSISMKSKSGDLITPISPILNLDELELFCEKNLGVYELLSRIFEKQIDDGDFFSIVKFWEFDAPEYSWVNKNNLPLGLLKVIQSFHDVTRITDDNGMRAELTFKGNGKYGIYLSQTVSKYDQTLKRDVPLFWVDLPWHYEVDMALENYEIRAIWDSGIAAINMPSAQTHRVFQQDHVTFQVIQNAEFFTCQDFTKLEIFTEKYCYAFGYHTSIQVTGNEIDMTYLKRSK